MKRFNLFAGIIVLAFAAGMSSCENENINPYDYAAKTDTITINTGDENTVKTAIASYPTGSIVWAHDTTLTSSFKIPLGASLYIEPGVKVTISSKPTEDHPVEIVALGNLYVMGTKEKPVVINSDTRKPNDWGGIICGYDCSEVVLSHAEIAHAGATPTESSLSFQNKLFKTTIDGGVPAFHFCNTKGRFTIANCFFHDNYNDQTYFTGGNGVIYGSVFADSGNESDGGEAINVKSGCILDISYNVIYNACTNAFKLSGSGVEKNFASKLVIYNNTAVDCGWRRAKNKKGGNVWIEKGIAPVFVNNLLVDNRYGMRQPDKNGADIENSVLYPNYFFASTETGVEQQSKDFKMIVWDDRNITSSTPENLTNLFVNFAQSDKMNINCQSDDTAKGAPLKWNDTWDFHLKSGATALSGATSVVTRNFPGGLAFFGMKKVKWSSDTDDQNYYFTSPVLGGFFGAFSTK
ncbi:MAG: hypothetical protein ACOYJK_01900 [Prevotella sp.]|jgi:hypothetical protein